MQDLNKVHNRLEQAASNSDQPLERRLADFVLWYKENRDRIPKENVHARLEFTDKALWILIEIFALFYEADLSRRRAFTMPNGVKLFDPLRSDPR